MNEYSKFFDTFSTSFVGFDEIRKHFERIRTPSFPPLNIYRENVSVDPATFEASCSGDYIFELALSGYKPTDVDIKVEQVNGIKLLTVSSEGTKDSKAATQWICRGIAGRAFTVIYPLTDLIEVKGAVMKDGLLTVRLSLKDSVQSVKEIPILTDDSNGRS